MERLKIIKIFGSECNICFSKAENDDQLLSVTKCGHLYCLQCLQEWYNSLIARGVQLEQCPVCKTHIKRDFQRKHELCYELITARKQLQIIRHKRDKIRSLFKKRM